jgi:hypothetical protein
MNLTTKCRNRAASAAAVALEGMTRAMSAPTAFSCCTNYHPCQYALYSQGFPAAAAAAAAAAAVVMLAGKVKHWSLKVTGAPSAT